MCIRDSSSNAYDYYDDLGYHYHAGSGVTYQGIESLTLESGAYDDTLIYQNNQINRYAGNGGTTFYADVSDWTVGLHWVNDGSEQTFSNGVEGFSVSGVERLLVQTGSGEDVIEQKIAQTNDEIRTGAGDDLIILSGYSGDDTIDGGAGIDTLDMDWSGQGYLTHSVELTTADGTVYRRIVNSDVGMDALSQLNAQAVSHAYGVGDYYQYGFYDTQGNYGEGQYYYGYAEQQVAYYKNIENITLNGTDYNDLFNYEGTGIGQFKGNGGTDTLYADLTAGRWMFTSSMAQRLR